MEEISEEKKKLRANIEFLQPLIDAREGFKNLIEHSEWKQLELALRKLRLGAIERMANAAKEDLALERERFLFVNEFVELLTDKKDFSDLETYLTQKTDSLIEIDSIDKDEREYGQSFRSGSDI